MTLPLLTIPNVLKLEQYSRELQHKVCRPIRQEEADLLPHLIMKMADFAKAHDGIGLAAPQVGLYVQLAVLLHEEGKIHALINPRVESFGGRDLAESEGCLSLQPQDQAQARVVRSEIVVVDSGTLENVDPLVRTTHRGNAARVIQHEIDHLEGTFFISRVSPLQRDLVLRRHNKWLRTGR